MPNFADLQQKEAESDAGDGSSAWNRTMCDPRSSCHDSDLLLPHSRVKCHGAVQASLVARMFSFDVKDQWKENQWKDFLKRSRL